MRSIAFALPLVVLMASVAVAEDRWTLPLERWEVGRAARDGAVPKLTPGVPQLPFAANQEDVLARTSFEVTAAVASSALVLELERVRWDASVTLDGQVVAKGLEGSARVELGVLAAGKHEVLVRARDVRTAGVAGRKPGDDDAVEAGWTQPLGAPPRLAGVLGAARVVERMPVEVVALSRSARRETKHRSSGSSSRAARARRPTSRS